MNEYDSDKMADILAQAQATERTDRLEDADIVLFNTCSVREKAQEKSFRIWDGCARSSGSGPI